MPPQDQRKELEELFPELTKQARPTSAPTTGVSPVEHRRDQIHQVAAQMRKDLADLRHALTALNGGCQPVGSWDVAQSLGAKVGTAHKNMVAGLQAYCQAYEAVIQRIEQTATNYGTAEDKSKYASERPGKQLGEVPPVKPWRTQ